MAGNQAGRSQNRERIFWLLLKEGVVTKQEVAHKLQLSMPTTLQNINDMLEHGILEECGSFASTGGRKAKKIRLKRDVGLGLGIDIALHHVELVITDLFGEVLAQQVLPIPFADTPAWYHTFGQALELFLQVNHEDAPRILSAGISFPGIIDAESTEIIRSHIFSLEHVGLERFRRCIPYPVVVANDANSACFAELCPEHHTYFYVSLNESVGGAWMQQGRLQLGDTWQAGEIGHMLLTPGGRRCYCGKHGCADAYLSPKVLLEDGRSLPSFFDAVQARSSSACKKWDAYLDHLAILLTNLRMMANVDLVVGGAVGSFIAPWLEQLNEKAASYDRFARDIDYIFPCKRREHAFAVGASMLALQQYSHRLLTNREEKSGQS